MHAFTLPVIFNQMKFNDDLLDTLSVLSFVIGMANYNENLSQSDKDEMIQQLNTKMNELLLKLEDDLELQNEMLRKILSILEKE